jgi:prophage regulatory protein
MQPLTNLLRLPAVARVVGLSRTTIYKRIEEGRFPAPINLGERAVAWREDEIAAWIAQRTRASRGASLNGEKG